MVQFSIREKRLKWLLRFLPFHKYMKHFSDLREQNYSSFHWETFQAFSQLWPQIPPFAEDANKVNFAGWENETTVISPDLAREKPQTV